MALPPKSERGEWLERWCGVKITSIDLFPVWLQVKKEAWTKDEYVWPSQVPSVIVRVNTNEGLYGLGEATSQLWYFGETRSHLIESLRILERQLRGADPTNIAELHRQMELTIGGGAPGCRSAVAAIDMAAYDLLGRAEEKPVYELLGGAYRTHFELLTNLYQKTPEKMAEACRSCVEQGFRGLKVKVGDVLTQNGWSLANLHAEVEKLQAALEATPDDVYVDADANQGWRSAKTTISVVRRRFDGYSNLGLEQPLRYFDLDGHRLLRESLGHSIILDESVLSPEMALSIVKAEAADRLDVKLNRVGGFWNARKIVAIAEAAALGISIDTSPFGLLGDTALCHLAATVREAYPVDAEGHLWFVDEPYVGGIEIQNGLATLPSCPGLGVELDEDALAVMQERER